jgi:hypothetical protein
MFDSFFLFGSLNGSATDNSHWMMGATINPSSIMAKEMSIALDNETKTHAPFDAKNQKDYVGVPFPRRRRVSQYKQNKI